MLMILQSDIMADLSKMQISGYEALSLVIKADPFTEYLCRAI